MTEYKDIAMHDIQSVTNAQKAQILMNALPYIKKYSGKIVVVKYGGNAMVNESLKRTVMGDIVLLNLIGIKVVLVHGGGPHIKEVLDRVGIESKFIDGLRVTDAETAEIVQMVLAGKVNKSLVSLIEMKGGRAIGLSVFVRTDRSDDRNVSLIQIVLNDFNVQRRNLADEAQVVALLADADHPVVEAAQADGVAAHRADEAD